MATSRAKPTSLPPTDRKIRSILRARSASHFLRTRPPLQLRHPAVDVIGLGQVVVGRGPAGALRLGQCGDLRQLRRVRHPFVALVAQEQAEHRLRARAGHADVGDGAMRVLDGKLQRGAQLMRIERAMARLVLPARVLLDELLVADRTPVADARRVAGQRGVVVGRTIGREAHRHIRIALARGKAVPHADDEQIADLHEDLGDLPAADVDRHPGAVRIGDLELQRRIARQRDGLAALAPAGRLGAPGAIDGLRVVEPLHVRQDGVALGVQIVGALAAAVPVALAVPAGLGEHGRAPPVGVALGHQALGRQHRALALGVSQAHPGGAMHLGVGWIEEEAERVLDLPGDARLGMRRRAPQRHQHEGQRDASAGIASNLSLLTPASVPFATPA